MDHRHKRAIRPCTTPAAGAFNPRTSMRDRPWLVFAAVLAVACALALAMPAHASKRDAAAGEGAAGFSFTDIRGGKVRLADYRGRWVLVNFWAPWCPLCRMEVPYLNHLEQSREVAVVGVAMDYGPDRDNALDMARSMAFVNVMGGNRFDPDNASAQVGPVHFYPVSYLYNPKGEQVARLSGPLNEARVRKAMREAAARR